MGVPFRLMIQSGIVGPTKVGTILHPDALSPKIHRTPCLPAGTALALPRIAFFPYHCFLFCLPGDPIEQAGLHPPPRVEDMNTTRTARRDEGRKLETHTNTVFLQTLLLLFPNTDNRRSTLSSNFDSLSIAFAIYIHYARRRFLDHSVLTIEPDTTVPLFKKWSIEIYIRYLERYQTIRHSVEQYSISKVLSTTRVSNNTSTTQNVGALKNQCTNHNKSRHETDLQISLHSCTHALIY